MRLVRLAAALAAALLLAACGSAPPAPPQEQSGTSSSAPATAGHGALANCLSDHGVPAETGPAVGPPPGVDQDVWQKAMTACSTLAPGPAS
ncbi:MAG: hypothetical protein ABW137_27275 [Mycobacterium sp.]